MSAVAAIYNVPGTRAEFDAWAFAHAAHHTDIIRTLHQIVGSNLDQYVLDPFNPDDPGVWLYQHQVMHQQMDAILAIGGYDLLDADFKDKDNLAGWIWLNADEHKQASDILGIG
jgi:hypothetical protein